MMQILVESQTEWLVSLFHHAITYISLLLFSFLSISTQSKLSNHMQSVLGLVCG